MIDTNNITAKNEALRASLISRANKKGLLGDDRHAYVFGTLNLVGKLRGRKTFRESIIAPLAEKGRSLFAI